MKRLQYMNYSPGQWLARCIIRRAQQLTERRTVVKVQWVLGYMDIKGNERSDEMAKDATERPGIRRCPEQFTSLAHLRRTITEQKWKEARHWLREENDRRLPLQTARYDLALGSQDPNVVAIERTAQVSRRYFQLNLGHAVIGTYLGPIGKTETNQCWESSSRAWMDMHHILFNCRTWKKKRRKMHERCEKDCKGQPRTVRRLMWWRKVTPAVIVFIAATRACQRA